jgi:CO/xanthine dehydrogenase Mo-binding subunit/aerobic-type carbon monoxide dehydrogenase small subunit (CoxS/CutS family)
MRVVDTSLVRFTLNGRSVEASAPVGTTLLRYLRDTACLRGTKNGCSTNHCGACTVLVDGRPVNSCVTRLEKVAGARVDTVEGLAVDGRPHPIQAAFLAAGAVQCGFCTPAMVLRTKALLAEHPDPDDDQIKTALESAICRCTGYVKIIQAVKLAARWVAHPDEVLAPPEGMGLGRSAPDWDGVEKALGALRFADDLEFPGMLYGKVLWSAHPSAQIVTLDVTAARDLPGVHAVFTAADVPGHNGMGVLVQDQPVLCADRVRFTGDAVAVAFAESVGAAERAVAAIAVEYRELPGVYSAAAALAPGAPLVHERGNVCKSLLHEVGDVAAGFAQAAVVVQGHFETPAVEHAYLEPESALATLDDDGNVVVYAPSQFPFELRRSLAGMLGVAEEAVRVVVTPIGGGFGGKIDPTVEGLVALGATRLRHPVKITLTRAESLRVSTKRHPYQMDFKVGVDAEGRLTAVQAYLLSDAGPYTSLSPRVIDQAALFSCGPYRVPNVRVDAWAVFSNNCNGGAFRGFGINQVAVALESLLDEAGDRLGLDPFELRLRNALDVGDRTISGEILRASVATKATIVAARDAYAAEAGWVANAKRAGRRVGVGVACGFKNVGAGKGKVDDAGATLTLLASGRVQLRASVVDMGQGVRTTMAQIAAEATHIPEEHFTLITGDTAETMRHGGAAGERQTLIAGKAVQIAATQFHELLLAKAAEYAGLATDQVRLAHGSVFGSDGRLFTLPELARKAEERWETLEAAHYHVAPKTFALADTEGRATVPEDEYRNYPAYAYTTQAAIVEVDQASGEVAVLKIIAAHDCGRAINPQKIEGQVEGSCLQGLGYALSERYVLDRGRPVTRTFGQLGVPTIRATPQIVTLLVEDAEPCGPFGAKGISEVATVPVTPAILNAIYDAIGFRAHRLPADAATIREFLLRREGGTAV